MVGTTKVYAGVGADIVMESISPTTRLGGKSVRFSRDGRSLVHFRPVLSKTLSDAGSPSFLRIVLIAVFYALFFWRTMKGNRGNRVIECGCAALTVFMVLIVLINIKGLPEWLMPSFGALLLFLCLLTMFFFVQQTI